MKSLYANKEERKIMADKSEKAFGRRGLWLKKAKAMNATLLEMEEAMDRIIEIREKQFAKAADEVIEENAEILEKLEDKNESNSKEHKPK